MKVLSKYILEQQKGQSKAKNDLQFVSKMKRANLDAPSYFPILEKDKRIEYEFLFESRNVHRALGFITVLNI